MNDRVNVQDFEVVSTNTWKQKVWLLLIMLILPMAVVSMPTVLVSHYFGRQPTFSKPVHKNADALPTEGEQWQGLRRQLESISARELPDNFRLKTSSNSEPANDSK